MVAARLYPPELEYQKAYTLQFIHKGEPAPPSP